MYLLFLSSCQVNENITQNIQNQFNERNIKFEKNLKYCIIMPEMGCSGCISEGTLFIKNNLDLLKVKHNQIRLIFTSIISEKMLLRNIGLSNLEEYYFVQDSENKFRLNNNQAIYPLILYLNNGVIEKAEFQSPNSPNALLNLQKIIINEN